MHVIFSVSLVHTVLLASLLIGLESLERSFHESQILYIRMMRPRSLTESCILTGTETVRRVDSWLAVVRLLFDC